MKPKIGPIRQQSTSALIADQLRQAIKNGSFEPGEQLGELELATRFEVSRGPLREAMQRLVAEGLLRSERNRGLFVNSLSAEDIADIYTVRTAIESAAIRLVVERDDPRSGQRLRKAYERMTTAAERGDRRALSDADLAFHETLVAESVSPRLRRLADTLLVESRMCINALQDTYSTPLDLADEHGVIVQAIAESNLDRALQAIDAHMRDAMERLIPAEHAIHVADS